MPSKAASREGLMTDLPFRTAVAQNAVHAELVEALSWFFEPQRTAARRKEPPFDKLRANGVGEEL
jgi:hypothetical protein